MERETQRIIQVSLSKISDSRRRRGGPLLRRSLLVSNVLNNAITTSETPYKNYRTPKELDIDCDVLEQEAMCVDRPNSLRDDTGGSGNPHELRTTSNNVQESKVLCERNIIQNQVINTENTNEKDTKSYLTINTTNSEPSNKESSVKSGLKRPRSQHVNEPYEKHAVTRKKCRTIEKNSKDNENIEPMDVSVLVNVFSSSLSGLSGFPTNSSSSESFIFSCVSPTSNSGYSLPQWPQTVAAF